MTNWLTNGGCMNGIRFADEGGTSTRLWIAAADTSASNQPNNKTIIVDISQDSDDMNDTSGDFVLEWRADGGSWADLAATGDLKWGTVSDYANGDSLPTTKLNGTENCSGMGVDPSNEGFEREGANSVTITNGTDGEVTDNCWAVDISAGVNGTDYEFRVSESGGGSGVYKTFTGIFVSVVTAGKIDVVSRNADSSATVGSVTVSAFTSDEAGSDPKPIGEMLGQIVTNGSGVGTITGLVSGSKYFLHYYKDDTTDLADGTIEITAVDV